MRRSGKSTLLDLLAQKLKAMGSPPALKINLEEMVHADLVDAKALYQYCKSVFTTADLNQVLMLDEVQEVPGWERCVNSLLAEGWCDVIVTGSNAHLFSSGLATLLSGRFVIIPVYPLSFREYCSFRACEASEEALLDWLRWGGLPGLHRLGYQQMTEDSPELGREYLQGILDTVVLKDVIERHPVRDAAFLAQLLRFVMGNLGNLLSAKSISDWVKSDRRTVSVETVQIYLGHLGDAQLVYPVQRFDIKGKALLAYQEKLFVADLGLRHALIPWRLGDIAGMLENVVFLELMRRGMKVTVGKVGDREIDFVAEKGDSRQYIQVTYLLASPETIEREFQPLEEIRDHYPKLVLSMDRFNQGGRNGVVHRYLLEWLMAQE